MMDFNEIKQILDMMREHDLAEFELERDNVKLRLRKNAAGHWTAAPAATHYPPSLPPSAPAPANDGSAATVLGAADEAVDLAVIKSPIVGTFYRAPEPGAKPFADVGDSVRKGPVICIIGLLQVGQRYSVSTGAGRSSSPSRCLMYLSIRAHAPPRSMNWALDDIFSS